MNGYVCFWRGKQREEYALTSLQARDQAAAAWKCRKPYEVTAVLAERDGIAVTHTAVY